MARIVSITRHRIVDERLYNLAVEGDESFVADGIVVHNCKSFLVANLVGKTNKEIDPGGLQPSSKDLLKYITLTDKKKV